MTDDISETIDWRGEQIDCRACRHKDMAALGKCKLSHACVNDRYARRIDRFFNWNPELSNDYLKHEYFEIRAIASKRAAVFLLPALLDDAEETVRWNAARRLPKKHILKLRHDPHREVRIRIVSLLDDADLVPMLQDEDYYVRQVIARKLAPNLLEWIAGDPEPEVRRAVAQRAEKNVLLRMMTDKEPRVRVEVARRLSPEFLARMRADEDWRVRHEAASRIEDKNLLAELAEDEDEMVRETARRRLEDEDEQHRS